MQGPVLTHMPGQDRRRFIAGARQEYRRARYPGDASGIKQIKKGPYRRQVGDHAGVNGAGAAMPDPHDAVDDAPE